MSQGEPIPNTGKYSLLVPKEVAKSRIQALVNDAISKGNEKWVSGDDAERLHRFGQLKTWKARCVLTLGQLFDSDVPAKEFDERISDRIGGNHEYLLSASFRTGNALLDAYLHELDNFPLKSSVVLATEIPQRASVGESAEHTGTSEIGSTRTFQGVRDHPVWWLLGGLVASFVLAVSTTYYLLTEVGGYSKRSLEKQSDLATNQNASSQRLVELALQINDLRDQTYQIPDSPESLRLESWKNWHEKVITWYEACVAAFKAKGASVDEYLGSFSEIFGGTDHKALISSAEVYPNDKTSTDDRKKFLWPKLKDSEKLLLQAAMK